ncbi:BadF/BadG/BcrA/BcrD ATPase family protein [Methanosarcina sp.]|uniref:BadF/BadG/BcrA/BcrD ATPase family protein n=1 Tax=Methanosarcina sp. TaxID=2213 RepID=UPI003C728775
MKFADRAISEITAHARGVYHLCPDVNGIIDIGGQDSKVISVNGGKVTDFLMKGN